MALENSSKKIKMEEGYRNIFSGDREIFDRIERYVKDCDSQIVGTTLCDNTFTYYLSNKSQVRFDDSTLSVSVNGIDDKLSEIFRDFIVDELSRKESPQANLDRK